MIVVPVVPGVEYADPLEPADRRHVKVRPHHLLVHVRDDRLFKIEVKAAHHFGRFGYFRELGGGMAGLIVRLFFNNPSAPYVMEAPHGPGIRGYSLDIYHDDGRQGGIAEMECHGQPVGGPRGTDTSRDQFVTWSYRWEARAIRKTAEQLLGVKL